ncbi:IPT/TIG domain protein [compost metagenome]
MPPPPPAPVVESVSPGQIVITTPTNVMITGKNFINGAKVKLGDTIVAATFYNNTQLLIRTPVWNQAEDVDVTVINPDTQTGSLAGGIKFILPPPPSITSVTPNSAVNTGGSNISIKGTNFAAGTKVFINNVQASSTFYSVTEVQARVPASAMVGPVDVMVLNTDGQSYNLAGGFTYTAPAMKPAPVISGVSPNNGPKSGGNLITVTGANFESTTKVYINGVLTGSSFYSASSILVRVPASTVTGAVELRVVNADGQTVVLADGYTYN